MRVGGRADEDRIDIGGDHLVDRGHLGADALGEGCRGIGDGVGHVRHAGAARIMDGAGMHLADSPRTQDTKPDQLLPPR